MRVLLMFCIFMLSAFPSFAEETHERVLIEVEKAYAFATAPQQKNGAVFGVIRNLGVEHLSGKDLVVHKAESDVAERIELHTHEMDGDTMMMREVERYDLPDGKVLTLEPMGYHIMLIGLKEPLKEGESFPMTVYIGDGSDHDYGGVTFDVDVVAPGTKPEEH